MALPSLEDYFPDWKEREALAEAMIPLIGRLYRKNVVCYCFGRAMYNQNVMQLMKTHRYVRQIAQNELSEFESFPILEAMSELDLGPSHIDVGRLASKYMESIDSSKVSAAEFVQQECAEVIGRHVPPLPEPQDVVLYGFGRIGRLLARLLVEKTGSGEQLRLRAIVVRKGSGDDLIKRASLLRRDSVHGSFREPCGLMKKIVLLSPTVMSYVSSMPAAPPRLTTSRTVSKTQSSSTTPVYGATKQVWASTLKQKAPLKSS